MLFLSDREANVNANTNMSFLWHSTKIQGPRQANPGKCDGLKYQDA